MGTFPPQHSHMNETTPQQYFDQPRFSNMAGFPRSLDSSESGGSEYSPSRTLERNEKQVKRRASRAGTRSVSTLTPAQLSRKRANDREAQRAIRQRTKEHIEKLELRIAELESCGDSVPNAKFDEILLRNAVLERQIIHLTRQLQLNCTPYEYNSPKLEYDQSDISPGSHWSPSSNFSPSAGDSMTNCDQSYINPGMTASTYPTTMHIPLTPEGHPPFLDTTVGSSMCGITSTANDHGSPSEWTNVSPTMDQTGNTSGCPPIARPVPTYPISPASSHSPLYRQPAMFSWEIPTKVTSATNPVDSMLLAFISSQRSMSMNGMPLSQVAGPTQPNMKSLIYDDPETRNSTHPMCKVISDILNSMLMVRLPERAASFYIMYTFLQWQIAPSQDTFNNVPEWFQPRPSQQFTPHAMWVDMVPFHRLRDRIIDQPDLYETEEFQHTFYASLNLNWPYRDMDVLEVVNDGRAPGALLEVRVTDQFKRHFLNLANWSLDSRFALRYPELADFCRFTERDGKEGGSGHSSPARR